MMALVASTAYAGFWDRPLRRDLSVGASVVVNLGRVEDRARVGAAVDARWSWFWAEIPYYHDGPVNLAAPEITLAAHAGWTHPVVWSEVTAVAGPLQPLQVYDGGYLRLIEAQAGVGLGMATDGAAGPLLVGALHVPSVEARVEATRWGGGWHAPRLLVGPHLSLDCCSTLL